MAKGTKPSIVRGFLFEGSEEFTLTAPSEGMAKRHACCIGLVEAELSTMAQKSHHGASHLLLTRATRPHHGLFDP